MLTMPIYGTIAVGGAVLLTSTVVVALIIQAFAVLFRFVDDRKDKGLWFIPAKYRTSAGTCRFPAGSTPARLLQFGNREWTADGGDIAITVAALGLAVLLWPVALTVSTIVGFVFLLRGLRRGQKAITKLLRVAHRHETDGTVRHDV